MNKNEMCVLMSDEMDVRNAEIMLISYGEKIDYDFFKWTDRNNEKQTVLLFTESEGKEHVDDWILCSVKECYENLQMVSISQLEEILKQK